MSKYRYAKAQGEFLPSRFLSIAQSPDPSSYTTEQAYDLTKDFISGTDVRVNSFISDIQLSGYSARRNLIAWWRLDKDISAAGTVSGSAPNGITLSAPTDADRPAFDIGDTPTKFVQASSALFSGTQFLTASDSDVFSFGNGITDAPFSISIWVKFSTISSSQYIVAKYNTSATTREYYFSFNAAGYLVFYLYDESSEGYAYVHTAGFGSWAVDTWYHFVGTYAGNAAAVANSVIDNGMRVYIDGVNATSGWQTHGLYAAMENTSTPVSVGNIYPEDATGDVNGNLADVAIWNTSLSAHQVSNLYGVSTAGAYRLVRNFDEVSPENDTRLMGVATRSRGADVSGLPADMMEGFRQGVHIQTFQQLVGYMSFKVRAASDFITTLDGKDISRRTFDESIVSPSSWVEHERLVATGTIDGGKTHNVVTASNSGRSQVRLGGKGRVSSRLSHEREPRDLGQTDVYTNLDGYEPYEDTLDLDPVAIISRPPDDLILPRQLVVQTSNEAGDGAIEPLVIRSKIDNTSIEQPFFAHDIRASLGGMTDSFRKSLILDYGWDLDDPKQGTSPFLDSVEQFGHGLIGANVDTTASGSFHHLLSSSLWSSGALDLPGALSVDHGTIKPYTDYLNERDKEYTTNSVSSTISQILIQSASFQIGVTDATTGTDRKGPIGKKTFGRYANATGAIKPLGYRIKDDDMRTHDKMSPAGFVFDNDPIGIDSIAFGGLKK